MKIETDNRKKGNIAPKAQPIEQPETKTVSKNKYFKINGVKVLTPSDIKLLPYEGYLVFGDPKIKSCRIEKQHLDAAKANNLVIVLLKKTKDKDGSTAYAFSEKMDIVKSYRKARLANAIHLQAINEAFDKPTQTKDEFIKSEFESEFEGIELEVAYLKSENVDLLAKDIKRLITLIYQTDVDSGRIQPKKKTSGIAKVK
jgi:hypothetical protein